MLTIFKVECTEDHLRCLEVRRQVFVQEQGVALDHEIEFEEESTHFLVLQDQQPVATGRFRIIGQQVKFERIATLLKVRGHGIGKALIGKMIEVANQSYPNYNLIMNAQITAKGFYEKLGWQAKGDTFDEAGIAHVQMVYPSKLCP
ncbi:MAG TPA: GNAT family N-acetyltransferase [Chlamydiales bacterium]|nr:GNAT family N-acetyltransferase [Chlamydiales bacterium]HPE85532.1 GNAT family N-acetyltransferase [Chlamydiales bacterium]